MSHPLKEIPDPMEPNKPRPSASMAVGIEADLEVAGDEFRKAVVASCKQTIRAADCFEDNQTRPAVARPHIRNAHALAVAILKELGETP